MQGFNLHASAYARPEILSNFGKSFIGLSYRALVDEDVVYICRGLHDVAQVRYSNLRKRVAIQSNEPEPIRSLKHLLEQRDLFLVELDDITDRGIELLTVSECEGKSSAGWLAHKLLRYCTKARKGYDKIEFPTQRPVWAKVENRDKDFTLRSTKGWPFAYTHVAFLRDLLNP